MQKFSYHTHTNSFGVYDGRDSVYDMIAKAQEIGFEKIGISNHGNDFSEGVTLTNNILNVYEYNDTYKFTINDKSLHYTYINEFGETQEFEPNDLSEIIKDKDGFVGFLHLDNRLFFDKKINYKIKYELLRDSYDNYKLFKIKSKSISLKSPVKELLKENYTSEIEVYYLTCNDPF